VTGVIPFPLARADAAPCDQATTDLVARMAAVLHGYGYYLRGGSPLERAAAFIALRVNGFAVAEINAHLELATRAARLVASVTACARDGRATGHG
jgi:hypothetical protein